MTPEDIITSQLKSQLKVDFLSIADDSLSHKGHAGYKEGQQTHLKLEVISPDFEGLSRLQRHRLIHQHVQPAFEAGLHALNIKAKTPPQGS